MRLMLLCLTLLLPVSASADKQLHVVDGDVHMRRDALGSQACEIADEATRDLREENEALREALERAQQAQRQAVATRDIRILNEATKVQAHKRIPGRLGSAGRAHIKQAQWKLVGTQPVFESVFINDDAEPLHLTSVWLMDKERGKDHAGLLAVDDQPALAEAGDVLAIIPAWGRVKISVLVEERELVEGPS